MERGGGEAGEYAAAPRAQPRRFGTQSGCYLQTPRDVHIFMPTYVVAPQLMAGQATRTQGLTTDDRSPRHTDIMRKPTDIPANVTAYTEIARDMCVQLRSAR